MLNTEIGKTGEVTVEGHVIGRLDGFTFAPEATEAGSDAKALQATAQKALAGEIEARAEKLAAAKDDAFVLASDGTIRWTGDAVAKLVAADDVLHPRIRIVSDERLTGPSREAVQARLELWLKTHVEKLLGPLFDLAKAEDVTGIARGIAFQLIEAAGVLERAKISAEMKDLDQPSRATLRKYGVRFGAYHIYIPSLLKPAARALASLLWALKQDNVDLSALSGAQHLASSGRTSFAVDKALGRDAYRVLGYKQCGERAVRVDILERLADLIRPALSWRPGAAGDKPAGAFDGRSFVVTQAMTSLTGSAGEDFASVLRALGYRMDKRPPLPPAPAPAVEAPVAEAAAVEAVAAEAGAETALAEVPGEAVPQVLDETGAVAETVVVEAPAAAETVEAVATPPETPEVLDESGAAVPQAELPTEAEAGEPAPVAATEASADSAVAEPAPEGGAATDAPPEIAAAPELVEVWRPGGRSEDRRPRHDRNRQRQPARPQEGVQPVAAEGESADGAKRERHGRRRERHKEFRKPRSDAPAEGATAVASPDAAQKPREPREDRGGRPPREAFKGKGREGRDRDKAKFGGKREDNRSGPSHRPYASSAPRERDRPADPNSPFAKLAALKEQLAAARKD